jgi:hypothetical protein
MGPAGTLRRRDGRWVLDSTHRMAGYRGRVGALCRLPASGGTRLLAGGDAGLLLRDGVDAPWRRLPRQVAGLLPSAQVTALRCDEPSRVLVGTVEGLAVLDLEGRDTAAWSLETTLRPADGLPSPHIFAISEGGAARGPAGSGPRRASAAWT